MKEKCLIYDTGLSLEHAVKLGEKFDVIGGLHLIKEDIIKGHKLGLTFK